MASQKRHSRRKSIQNSDPGKILDLVLSLTDDGAAQLEVKINTYLHDECDADAVLQVVIHNVGMEASIDAVDSIALPRKNKICMTTKMADVLKTIMEQSDILTNFGSDFQSIVGPYVTKDNTKKRVIMFPVCDKTFSVIVCVIAPKLLEEHAAILIHECFL
ncbi:unnamed protein product [Leptosia nina]|uniref:Uncharacterized protein n=1 Tax=Leptosia nina TaxID=320188 RepID=A0AAV1IUC3_9NEOP